MYLLFIFISRCFFYFNLFLSDRKTPHFFFPFLFYFFFGGPLAAAPLGAFGGLHLFIVIFLF